MRQNGQSAETARHNQGKQMLLLPESTGVAECPRQAQADRRNKGDEKQGNDHHDIEGQLCLDHLLHRALCNGGADEEDGSNGRGQKADAAVEHQDDAVLNRIDADRRGDGKQDRRGDQDDR